MAFQLENYTTRASALDAIAVTATSATERIFTSNTGTLWTPHGHPGAYGGQLLAQAIHSAAQSADTSNDLNSFHCLFLRKALDSAPVRYEVLQVRSGKSFQTYTVRGTQDEALCLTIICMFQKPELVKTPSVQYPMPKNIPRPEQLELDADFYRRQAMYPSCSKQMKNVFNRFAHDRDTIPMILTVTNETRAADGTLVSMRWIRSPGTENCTANLQKIILAYMSDFDLYDYSTFSESKFIKAVIDSIGVAPKALALDRLGSGPKTVASICTLSHSMHFYSDKLDCSGWILCMTSAPRTGSGRASVFGRFYSSDGNLVALALQEGVVLTNEDLSIRKHCKL